MKRYYLQILIATCLVVPLLFIYCFKVIDSYRYDSDFGRDIVDILQITRGDLTLIGPKLSFGGIHTGPYYYYLFAPFLMLGNMQPEALLIANAVLFVLAIVIGAWWLHTKENWAIHTALLAFYWLGLTPYMLFSARGPGNAFSYLPLMMLLLITFPWLTRQQQLLPWLIYGFFVGVVINTHLVAILVFAAIFVVFITTRLQDLKQIIKSIALAAVGVVLSYTPIFLFELRHDFVIFKNTFIQQSYKAFTDNTNLPSPLQSSKNPIENAGLLANHFSQWSGLHFTLIALVVIGLIALTRNKLSKESMPIVFGSILSFAILSFAARSQLAIHYFFPFIIAFQVALLWLLKNTRYPSIAIVLLLVANILNFPQYLYTESPRKIDHHRQFTQELIQSNILQELNQSSFNVFVARETPLAVLGWEYRYFLDFNLYKALPPTAYNEAQHLLLISESENVNPENLQSWELSEFGAKQIVLSKNIGNRNTFIYTKTN